MRVHQLENGRVYSAVKNFTGKINPTLILPVKINSALFIPVKLRFCR